MNVCISIIVPIYNAQKHLAACLSSIQGQSFQDWECICIDDGSTDNSLSIVEECAAKDPRFHVICQENQGPGVARNTGINVIKGEYFTFVDADDLISPFAFESLLRLAHDHGADLVVSEVFRFELDEEFNRVTQTSESISDQIEVFDSPMLPRMVNWKKFRVHPHGKLYKSSQHKKLHFPPLYGPEDAYVSFDVYGCSSRTVFLQKALYGYRMVEESLTRSVAKYRNYIIGDAAVILHCEEVCREHGVSNIVTKQLFMPYVMRIFHFINEMSVDKRVTEQEKQKLLEIAGKELVTIKNKFKGKYKIVPPVHYISYCVIRLKKLRLMIVWMQFKNLVSGNIFCRSTSSKG